MPNIRKIIPWLLILALILAIGGFSSWVGLLRVKAQDTVTTSGTVNNIAPTVSGVDLNAGADINLTENSTTTVECTGTITDENGGDEITSATATIYRSGVGSNCTADDNNCYQISSCTLGPAVGNDKNATCTVDIWFHADPTDAGTYATAQGWDVQTWQCQITATDAGGLTGSGTDSIPPEVVTLTALDVDSSITYDALDPGTNMASTSIAVNATTTGNVPIDIQLKGDDMTSGANSIPVSNQHYATSTVAYASGISLSGTYATLEVDMPKPTTSPSNSTDIIYWGWGVPSGTPAGTYTGTNYFNPVED